MLSQETRDGTAKMKDAAKSAACHSAASEFETINPDVRDVKWHEVVGLALPRRCVELWGTGLLPLTERSQSVR